MTISPLEEYKQRKLAAIQAEQRFDQLVLRYDLESTAKRLYHSIKEEWRAKYNSQYDWHVQYGHAELSYETCTFHLWHSGDTFESFSIPVEILFMSAEGRAMWVIGFVKNQKEDSDARKAKEKEDYDREKLAEKKAQLVRLKRELGEA